MGEAADIAASGPKTPVIAMETGEDSGSARQQRSQAMGTCSTFYLDDAEVEGTQTS